MKFQIYPCTSSNFQCLTFVHGWLFGMVEIETNTLLIYPVSDRSEDTLIPTIQGPPYIAIDGVHTVR